MTAPTAQPTTTGDRLQDAADRLRAARAQYPSASFVAVDPQVIDALAAWLEADAFVAGLAEPADDGLGFSEGLAVADAILWDVPR